MPLTRHTPWREKIAPPRAPSTPSLPAPTVGWCATHRRPKNVNGGCVDCMVDAAFADIDGGQYQNFLHCPSCHGPLFKGTCGICDSLDPVADGLVG